MSTKTKPFELRQRVDATVKKYLRAKNGIALAVGIVNGDEEHSFLYGIEDSTSSVHSREEPVFGLCLTSSALTTTLLAELHVSGIIDINEPATTFLPERIRSSCPWAEKVTLRHLACHSSGLSRRLIHPDHDMYNRKLADGDFCLDDFFDCVQYSQFIGKPGAQSYYSPFGIALLGQLLAKAIGQDFDILLRERICQPLGMTDTAIDLSPAQSDRLLQGYCKHGAPAHYFESRPFAGAHGIHSTLHDMMRFLRANVAPDSTPLHQAIELAQTPQTESSRWKRSMLAPEATLLLAAIFILESFGIPADVRVALTLAVPVGIWRLCPRGFDDATLGWDMDATHGELSQFDGNSAFASFIAFSREDRSGVVLLSNSNSPLFREGLNILRSIVRS